MANHVFIDNIEQDTINNTNYRKVVSTTKHQQLVLMSLKPKEDIEFEIHPDNDQFIRVEKGEGLALIGKMREMSCDLSDGTSIIIPAGTWHQIINTSDKDDLKLYTIYSPPHHQPGHIDVTRPPNSQKAGDQYFNKQIDLTKRIY